MSAVTTGVGVSGVLADNLERLIGSLRTDTGDSGWRLHMQLIHMPVAQYSLRVYAPDRYSQEHSVRITMNTLRDIWDILLNEASLWDARVRPVTAPAVDTATD